MCISVGIVHLQEGMGQATCATSKAIVAGAAGASSGLVVSATLLRAAPRRPPRRCLGWAGVNGGLACYAEAQIETHCGTHKGEGPKEG